MAIVFRNTENGPQPVNDLPPYSNDILWGVVLGLVLSYFI